MGTTAYGGKQFKETARVCGERPIGATGFRRQHILVSRQPQSPSEPFGPR